MLKYTIGYFWVYFLLSDIPGYLLIYLGICGFISFVEVGSQIFSFFLIFFEGSFKRCRQPILNTVVVLYLEIPRHVKEHPKYRVIPETLGLPQNIGYYPIFGVTRYPIIFKTESSWVGSESGSGARWAVPSWS